MTLTYAGRSCAQRTRGAPTLAELHQCARELLGKPEQKIFDVLLRARGGELGRTNVGELAGYEAEGGSFRRYLSTLSSLELIRYPKRTTVAAAAWLFPKGLS